MKNQIFFIFLLSGLSQQLIFAEDAEEATNDKSNCIANIQSINAHLVQLVNILESELQKDLPDTKDLTTRVRNFITRVKTENLYLSSPAVNTLSIHLSSIKEKNNSENFTLEEHMCERISKENFLDTEEFNPNKNHIFEE